MKLTGGASDTRRSLACVRLIDNNTYYDAMQTYVNVDEYVLKRLERIG